MRLPWLQIDSDGATRAATLGRLLGVGEAAGIGLTIRLWHWALEIAPEGDFSGGPHDSRLLAAAIGWNPDDSERLENELARVGLVAGLRAGLVRVRGLDRYKRAWEKNRRRKPAPAVPVTGNNPATTRAEPARKTETETETEIKKKKRTSDAPASPRFRPLLDLLAATFKRERGSDYAILWNKDGAALKALLLIATDEEISRRWLIALRATGWKSANTIAQLRSKWNDLTQELPSKSPVQATAVFAETKTLAAGEF